MPTDSVLSQPVVLAALISAAVTAGGMLLAHWSRERRGSTTDFAELSKAESEFRRDVLARLDACERKHDECLTRETALVRRVEDLEREIRGHRREGT